MKRRLFTLFVFVTSLFLLTAMMAQTVNAHKPLTENREAIFSPAFAGQLAWGSSIWIPGPAAGGPAQIAAMTTTIPTTETSTPNLQPISPENAAQLTQLAQLGKGVIYTARWSPDGKLMAMVGGTGIYLYDAETLQELKWIETQRPVYPVHFSPDGNRLVIGDLDGTIQVLDVATGQPLYSLEGDSGIVSVAISPSGDKFMVHRKYDSIQVWDMQTGQSLHKFELDISDDPVFSPDFQTLAISNNDDGTRVLDVNSGNLLYTLEEQAFAIRRAIFSPDGRQLAISTRGVIYIYDAETGQRLHALEAQYYALFLAFSPNSHILVSGASDNTVMLWDTRTGQRLHILDGQEYIYNFAFSPDSRLLAVGGEDGSLKLWDVNTGQSVQAFVGHTKSEVAVAFSPDGNRLMSQQFDAMRLWDANSGELVDTFEKNPPTRFVLAAGDRLIVPGTSQTTIWQWITATAQLSYQHTLTGQSPIAVSPDGEKLATSNENFTIQLWDISAGQPLSLLKGHAKEVTSLAFSPAGTILASSDKNEYFGSGPANNNTIRLWQVETGDLLSTYETTPWGASVKTFLAQNRLLAIRYVFDSCGRGGGHSNIALWNMADLLSSGSNVEPLWSNGDRAGAGHIALSANRKVIAASFQDVACVNPATVLVWDAETGAQLAALEYDNYVQALTLSPAGTTMAIGLNDGTFGLWDTNTAELLHTFEGQTATVTNLAYSPDGRLLIAGRSDGHIQLWDTATRQLLHTLKGHTSTVIHLEFNSQGQLLVSSSSDGTIRVWGQP
jgi:WD40 repeat protein